ncbi:MAG TPA: non-homologous end-joining DNA ligase [Candidatus Binatia bacterium]|nr:non-homologous end-joining DNA ligase [Candidatus Binatia bacterium]
MKSSKKFGGKELAISNPDKVMFPEKRFTKSRVIEFYAAIARYLLPYIKDRPITMKRFPNGVGGEHFYEKDAPSFTPSWIKKFPVPRTGENSMIHYILLNDLPSLVWSANMANLEIHPFLAKIPHIERPTMLVFDLDPGEGADILSACKAAFHVKDVLDRLNLKSFVKVSGSKGIHLHVPLNTNVTYEVTQLFAKSIAQLLEREHPNLVVSEMPKTKRRGKVFVDWSQNAEYKSTVAVYSLRAKAKRPFVAMPVSWNELTEAIKKGDAAQLFIEPDLALRRLKKTGDLFAPVLKLKQTLPEPFLELMRKESEDHQPHRTKALDAYRRKRDFTKTPEPGPALPKSSRQGSRKLFVIQKHAARRLHYDFRLEMSGTLKSWAVPKGPPYELNERRLAVAVEDHPMDYAKFEGIIPRGEYGGGTVMVWDIGTYELIDGNYWQGKLHIFLSGEKLKGEWVFVKDAGRDGKDNVWYCIKAGASVAPPRANEEDSSALSGRSMDEIAGAADAVWHSNRNGSDTIVQADSVSEETMDALPKAKVKFVEPMLAKSVTELPEDRRAWIYEVKVDGYRCLVGKDRSAVKLWSRRGNLFNQDFPGLARACAALPPDTLVDGEVVALDQQGRMSFNLLQHRRSQASAIRFYAFDLLVYKGHSAINLQISERHDLLAQALANVGGDVQLMQRFETGSAELIRAAKRLGFEGIIAKRRDSLYEPGKRSGAWLKYKINQEQEFVIGGYTPGHPFDAVIVGYYRDGQLIYVAKVRNGFVPRIRREVAKRLRAVETDVCPFANLPEKKRTAWALTKEEMNKCVWIRPELVAQIEFTEWTPDGHLRHATFAGLREDKTPQEVVRE